MLERGDGVIFLNVVEQLLAFRHEGAGEVIRLCRTVTDGLARSMAATATG